MKDKISFSDLSAKYSKNSVELEEIDKLNINYENIVNNKKEMIDNYQRIINSINPQNIKDFEMQSKEYMEKIATLENEIRDDNEKAGRKAKLVEENKKILEQAKERKQELEKQVFEDYEKAKKDEEKNMSKDVKNAQKEIQEFKAQLAKIEKDEEKYPDKARDSKYKEFLRNKIKEKEQFVDDNKIKSSAEEQKEFLLKEIRNEYIAFKKGIVKEYMPDESRNPNPVLEKAKEQRKRKQEKEPETHTIPIEKKIENVQQEMENQNRNYKGINLEANPYVNKVNINKPNQEKTPKNTFEIENAINTVYQQMEDNNRSIAGVKETGQMPEINVEKPEVSKTKTRKKEKWVDCIEISEKDGNIIYNVNNSEQEHSISIKQALEEKQVKFKRLGISKMCKEIAGGKIKGMLLKRKINPEIIAVLQDNSEQIEEYINCIHKKEKLPFELVHDCNYINIFKKLKLNSFINAEAKSGAIIKGKMFNKNKTLKAKEKTKAIAGAAKEKYETVKTKREEFMQKISNKDSKIEAKAKAALAEKESEKELAEGVKAVMGQEEKERE